MSRLRSWSDGKLLEKDIEIRKEIRAIYTRASAHSVATGAMVFAFFTSGSVPLGSLHGGGVITRDLRRIANLKTHYEEVKAEIKWRNITHKRHRLGFRGRISGVAKGLGHAALEILIDDIIEDSEGTVISVEDDIIEAAPVECWNIMTNIQYQYERARSAVRRVEIAPYVWLMLLVLSIYFCFLAQIPHYYFS